MSTFTQILFHIVFGTKNRERTLVEAGRPNLFKYVWGVLDKKRCHPYRINGIEDHIHIATHIHPTLAVSDIVKDIKLATSSYIQQSKLFPRFAGWQNGYAVFTYSYKEKDRLIEYIKNQEEHHRSVSVKQELIELLKEHYVAFDEKYLI